MASKRTNFVATVFAGNFVSALKLLMLCELNKSDVDSSWSFFLIEGPELSKPFYREQCSTPCLLRTRVPFNVKLPSNQIEEANFQCHR